MTQPTDLGDRETTRQCGNRRCRHLLTRADERAGRCPLCGGLLLTLSPAEAFQKAFVEKEETDHA